MLVSIMLDAFHSYYAGIIGTSLYVCVAKYEKPVLCVLSRSNVSYSVFKFEVFLLHDESSQLSLTHHCCHY